MTSPLDSPAFRRWFGNSVVVDANGEPLVVYHGTQLGYKFSSLRGGTVWHPVIWSTDSAWMAGTYAHNWPGESDPVLRDDLPAHMMSDESLTGRVGPSYDYEGGHQRTPAEDEERWRLGRSLPTGGIYRVYLRIENPLVIDAKTAKGGSWKGIPVPVVRDGQPDIWYTSTDNAVGLALFGPRSGHRRCDWGACQGRDDLDADARGILNGTYDGLIIHNLNDGAYQHGGGGKGTVFAVADPHQIKSASLNDGSYDVDDPSLTSNPRKRRTSKRKSSKRKSSRR
jgi:hypothetical protein